MGLARPSDEHGARPHFETGPYVHYCAHRGCIRASASPVGRSEPNRFCFKHRPDWRTCCRRPAFQSTSCCRCSSSPISTVARQKAVLGDGWQG
nr:hypothetical protein [Sinorhizobium meliloti]